MINCEFENGNKAKLRHAVCDCIVIKDGKVLLGKRHQKLLESGKWGLAGGFMEHDETIEQALRREVKEETGWEIKNPTLMVINDNPNRTGEDRQNIDFVFFAEASKKTSEPDDETSELKWFALNKLPPASEMAFDHLEQIEMYKKWLKQKFDLPKKG